MTVKMMTDVFMEIIRSRQFLGVTGSMILIIPAIFYLSSLSRKPVKVDRKPLRKGVSKPGKTAKPSGEEDESDEIDE